MDKNQAKEILRNIVTYGNIILSNHCRAQMQKRKVTTDDILHVLMCGNINKVEENPEYNNWQVEIEGQDLDDDQLTVQAAINENERTIIITVY